MTLGSDLLWQEMLSNRTWTNDITGRRWAVTGHVVRWTSPRPPVATGGPLVRPLVIDWQAVPQPVGAEGPFGGSEGRTAMRVASMNAVIVLAALFSVITLSTTAALVIFCRKKNSVFAMQRADDDADSTSEVREETFELRHIGVVIESHPLQPAKWALATSPHLHTVDTCVTDISDCDDDENDVDCDTTDTPLLSTNQKPPFRLVDTRVALSGAGTVCNALCS